MTRRIRIIALVFVMIFNILPFSAGASVAFDVPPYALVEYSYTTETPVGTIRYVNQNPSAEYFYWDYWPTQEENNNMPNYETPTMECGTACISMALSYVGVDRTPRALLNATKDGSTGKMWGKQGDAVSSPIGISAASISTAMDNFINGNGKYSPLCVWLKPYPSSAGVHWVILVGKIGENKYLALNPWHETGGGTTFEIQITDNSVILWGSYKSGIISVNQWYNENAIICNHTYNDVGVCTNPECNAEFNYNATYKTNCAGIYTVSKKDGVYLKNKPYGAAEKISSLIKKGTEIEVLGSVKNHYTDYDHIWYKVSYKGETGYIFSENMKYKERAPQSITCTVTSPAEGEHVPKAAYPLKGTVTSSNPLQEVKGYVDGHCFATVTLGNVTTLNLQSSPLNDCLDFASLTPGNHTLVIKARDIYHTDLIVVSTVNFVTEGQTTCSHSYSSSVTTAPSCEMPGVRTYICSKCNASYTESIAATGHSYGHWVVVTQPGCTTNGVEAKTCSGCGDSYTREILAAGHDYYSITIEATCTDYAKTRYACNKCDHFYDIYIDPEYSDWSTTKPTGIDESSIQVKTEYSYQIKEFTESASDSLPGWELYDVYYALGEFGPWSDWSETVVTANETTKVETRNLYGYYYFLCTACGAHMHGSGVCYKWAGGCGATGKSSWQEFWYPVSWNDANLKDWYGTGWYYTVFDGQIVFKWSDNPQVKTQYRYATRNKVAMYKYFRWSDWSDWSAEPIAASDAVNVKTRTLYRYIIPKNVEHSWDGGVITTPPTCTSNGIMTYTCYLCSLTYAESIASTGHSYGDWTISIVPGCTTNGTEERKCYVCQYSETRTIDALGHTNGVTVKENIVDPTCTESGSYDSVIYCVECNAELFRENKAIDKLGHELVNIEGITPDCLNPGYTAYKDCLRCDYIEGKEEIPAIGHSYSEWYELKAPTCTNSGTEEHQCVVCQYTETRTIESFGHVEADAIEENRVEPTCTEEGNYDSVVYCSVCNAELFREIIIIPKHNHDISGECGDNLTWFICGGELVIEGTGDMWDYGEKYDPDLYAYVTSAPWSSYVDEFSSLSLSKGITSIGDDAFFGCANLTGDLTIPNGVTEIGCRAFAGCNFFGDLKIPNSVVTISQSAFDNCAGFSGSLIIGDSVAIIGESAFSGCCGFVGDLTIPNSVISIGKYAFSGCSGFAGSLTIGGGIEIIGDKAFSGCTGFTGDLLIPRSVKTIGEYSFNNCTNIKKVYFKGNAPAVCSASNFSPSFDADVVTLYYRSGTTGWTDSEYYNEADGTWNGYKLEAWDIELKCSLRGIVVSYNPAISTTITLVQKGESAYTYTIESASGEGAVADEFVLVDIEEGVYDLVITKGYHLSYTIQDVYIDDDIDLQEHSDALVSNITLIAGDANEDGCVDLKDVTILTSSNTYGKTFDEVQNKSADINGDGCFDLKDLTIITSDKNYGKAPIVVEY